MDWILVRVGVHASNGEVDLTLIQNLLIRFCERNKIKRAIGISRGL